MNDGLIPNRYAKALYKFALETGEAPDVYDQMKQLDASFAASAQLKRAVNNPFVEVGQKEQLLLTAAGAKTGSALDRFVLLVMKQNRVVFLRDMALAYMKLYRQQRNIAKVDIATAAELPSEQINAIIDVVKRQLEGKTIEMTRTIDPSLIGGFKVEVDSMVLDASVKNELKKLRLKLLA